MHSQQQQQQQPPPPPQSLMQSQHHNHHHHHQHQQHQQSTLPPQQQPSQQQQSQQHLHGNIAEQPHYHAQSHNHSHIDHSRGQHHINQSQQTHLQHRQQHQPHPQQQQQQHLHQQTHHQQSHHHHPHHQMQPTQPHHHMAHHGMAPMIPYGQNIMYTPHSMGPAFSTTGHIAPHAFNPAPLANHRSDPINVSSQPQPQNQPQAQPSAHTQPPAQPQTQAQQQPPIEQQPQQTIPQQPQPPPGNINPNNIAHMSQLPPPVINTSNPGVHPLSNGPMMDSHMQNRMTFSHMPQHFVQHPYGMHHPPQMMQFPMHQNYLGGLMPPPNAPMMTAKVPIDMVRPPYDLQNHAGPITAKVPSSQATPIIAKPPGAVPLVAGSQPQPAPTTTLVKQRRPRLAIVDPKTRHVFTDDELRGSPTGSTTPATDVSTSTTTTATSTSTTNANPVSVKPSQASVPKENEAVVSTQLAPEAKPVATNSSQSATVITKKHEQARLEDHVHHSPQHASTPSPLTAKASTLDDTQQVVTKEQSRTPNAITTSASTLADSMQALSVTPLEHSKEPSIKTNVQENLDDAKVIQTDVVDKAIPREEGDTVLGDKEDNHETADQVEPPAKKLNPDFPYEAGQYSPLNPAGHRRYTMEFLKAVGRSMQLEDREADNDFFRPNFVQNTIHNDYSIPRRSSQQALNNKQPVRRIIATQSLQPEVAFKTSENPWKPELEKEKTKAVETGEIDTQRLLKVFRGLLNKITPQKYDSIIEKIEMLNLEGDDRLKSVIDLVFDKAVDEPGFCELYARMSKVIAARNSQFNHHLLKKCQDEFETNDLYIGLNIETREVEIENETDPNKKKFLSDELYEDMRLRRKKYLGTIKLIGEMYKLDLLVPKIIGFCISRLLTEVSNENLECLCSLIVTVGPKMLSENDEKIRASIKNTLQILSEIANSKKTNELFTLESRIKFKILDTIDLSRKNWKPRMVENNPKKLSEIHEETKQRPQNFSRSSMKNNDSAVPPRRNIQNQSFMRR